jgi:nitrite reductase (NO-forming)
MKTRAHSELLGPAIAIVLLFSTVMGSQAQTSAHKAKADSPARLVDIVRDPGDVPPPIAYKNPALVRMTLTAQEVMGTLDPSAQTTYRYWTFNGKVPGPMIRVRQGDTIELTLRNDGTSHMAHSIDLHAALGPGGGAAFTQAVPGQSKTFTFQATTPGLFVYHCGTPMIAEHMANGMYGLILVEPEGGLPHVDHEYYVMQGEIYTAAPKGKDGLQQFSAAKLMAETPEYFVFNGAVDALTAGHVMKSNVGETVRVFFGNAGPNQTAATHTVGEIFTKVYEDGSLTVPPRTDLQTVGVPPGSAAVLEFATKIPGKFALMDHSIARMSKGLMAAIEVSGFEDGTLMHAGKVTPKQESQSPTGWVSGMTTADEAQSQEPIAPADPSAAAHPTPQIDRASMLHMGMDMGDAQNTNGMEPMGVMGHMHTRSGKPSSSSEPAPDEQGSRRAAPAGTALNGCLTLVSDGRAILRVFHSTKSYRLEAQPLQFSANANRLVRVSGHFGSVMPVEDPNLASFVVDTVDQIAPDCSAKITASQIQKALAKRTEASRGLVGMSDMGFLPQTIIINAGEKVTWTNSSQVSHNVIADPGRAVFPIDVKLPVGVNPFGSGMLLPGQTFSRTFDVPGIYRYVCTLHETSGMKGVIIVRGAQVLRASK